MREVSTTEMPLTTDMVDMTENSDDPTGDHIEYPTDVPSTSDDPTDETPAELDVPSTSYDPTVSSVPDIGAVFHENDVETIPENVPSCVLDSNVDVNLVCKFFQKKVGWYFRPR